MGKRNHTLYQDLAECSEKHVQAARSHPAFAGLQRALLDMVDNVAKDMSMLKSDKT